MQAEVVMLSMNSLLFKMFWDELGLVFKLWNWALKNTNNDQKRELKAFYFIYCRFIQSQKYIDVKIWTRPMASEVPPLICPGQIEKVNITIITIWKWYVGLNYPQPHSVC